MIPRGLPYFATYEDLLRQREAYFETERDSYLAQLIAIYAIRFKRENRKRTVEKVAERLGISMRISRSVLSGNAPWAAIVRFRENQSRIQTRIQSKQKIVMFDEISEWPEENPVKVGGKAY